MGCPLSLWHLNDPELLISIENEVERDFSALRVVNINNKIHIRGRFDVYNDSVLYDSYGIDVVFAENHPEEMPQVFETENRLPKTLDRHFYGDKSACLFVPLERFKFWPDPRSISQFLGGPVNAFFYSQSFFDREGRWPFGERSHNFNGILESIKELCDLQTNREALIVINMLKQNRFPRQGECFCGKNHKFRHCHRSKVIHLSKSMPANYILFVDLLVREIYVKEPHRFQLLVAS